MLANLYVVGGVIDSGVGLYTIYDVIPRCFMSLLLRVQGMPMLFVAYTTFTHWDVEDMESYKIDDMDYIFSRDA